MEKKIDPGPLIWEDGSVEGKKEVEKISGDRSVSDDGVSELLREFRMS